VEEELAGIDDSWKEPRFDTLPHVVDVLTCRDPKEALLELQKQTDNIDVLVDDVRLHLLTLGSTKPFTTTPRSASCGF